MMISLDASTSSNLSAGPPGGTSHTFSHTVSVAGKDKALFVVVALISAVGLDPNTIAVTYNSVAMTKIVEANYPTKYITVAAFYLLKPSTGSNTVAVTWTNAAGGLFVARSYHGVDQAVPVRPSSWQTSLVSTNPSISVPNSTSDVILDALACYNSSSPTGTGHASLYGPIPNYCYVGHVPTPGSSPLSVGWSNIAGSFSAQCGFSIQAAADAGGVAVSPMMVFQ